MMAGGPPPGAYGMLAPGGPLFGGGGGGGGGRGGPPPDEAPPALGSIHEGVVMTVRPYGVFVALKGFRRHAMVHHTQARSSLFVGAPRAHHPSAPSRATAVQPPPLSKAQQHNPSPSHAPASPPTHPTLKTLENDSKPRKHPPKHERRCRRS